MSPDSLRAAGEALWGRWGWQTRMAETLRVDGSTVRRWLSGATHIPGPAEVALELLLEIRLEKKLATGLSLPAGQEGAADDPDGKRRRNV